MFLVPLWRALDRVRARGLLLAAALGLAFGAAAYAGGFAWLWRLVEVFLAGDAALGAALWVAYGLWFAASFVLVALAWVALRGRGWGVVVAGVAPLVAVEWALPAIFPVYAGAGLASGPLAAIQLAELGGPLLLTALLAAANASAFATWEWLRDERPRPIAAWLAIAALAGATLAYGAVRVRALAAEDPGAPPLRVGIVQANVGVLEKTAQGIATHRRHLEQTRELLATGPLDLVVWPETAYVRGLRRPLPIAGSPVRRDVDVPLLFGGTSVWEEDGRRRKANSAFLVGADGWIASAYDKNLLIPLAEWAPIAGLARWLPHVQAFHAASEVPPLALGALRLSTPICYEAIRPELVRRMAREARPHLLVTLANDAWFGDSQAPWMHLALARLRAVEHRRFLVRAANSGISAVVDPAGRVLAHTGLGTRETLRAAVVPREGTTPYARFGDWPGAVAAGVVGLGLVVRGPRRGPATGAGARDGC